MWHYTVMWHSSFSAFEYIRASYFLGKKIIGQMQQYMKFIKNNCSFWDVKRYDA